MNRNRFVVYSVLLGLGLFSWYVRSSLEKMGHLSPEEFGPYVVFVISIFVVLGWLANVKISDLVGRKTTIPGGRSLPGFQSQHLNPGGENVVFLQPLIEAIPPYPVRMYLYLIGLILSIVGIGYFSFFVIEDKNLAAAFGLLMAYPIFKSLKIWHTYYHLLALYKVGDPANFLVSDKAIWIPIMSLSHRCLVHYRNATGPYLRVPWNAIEGMEIYEYYAKGQRYDWLEPGLGKLLSFPNVKNLRLHLQLKAVANVLQADITPLELTQIELVDALEKHANMKVKYRSIFDDLKVTR